ncbi:hypothetical protein THAOC_27750, partial [Thalassiosira oceanica]
TVVRRSFGSAGSGRTGTGRKGEGTGGGGGRRPDRRVEEPGPVWVREEEDRDHRDGGVRGLGDFGQPKTRERREVSPDDGGGEDALSFLSACAGAGGPPGPPLVSVGVIRRWVGLSRAGYPEDGLALEDEDGSNALLRALLGLAARRNGGDGGGGGTPALTRDEAASVVVQSWLEGGETGVRAGRQSCRRTGWGPMMPPRRGRRARRPGNGPFHPFALLPLSRWSARPARVEAPQGKNCAVSALGSRRLSAPPASAPLHNF